MMVLFVILVFSTLALLGVAAAVFFLARRHMQRQASDTTLRPAMQEADEDQAKPIGH
jgi:uncharacterized protein YneF (UPF0154 family)